MSSDVFVGLVVLDVHVFNVLDVQDVCDDHNVFVVLDVHVGSFGTLWNFEGLLKAFTNEDILSSFEKLVYRHGASYLTVQYRHGASYLTVQYRHGASYLMVQYRHGASYLTVLYRHGASNLTVLYRHLITTFI